MRSTLPLQGGWDVWWLGVAGNLQQKCRQAVGRGRCSPRAPAQPATPLHAAGSPRPPTHILFALCAPCRRSVEYKAFVAWPDAGGVPAHLSSWQPGRNMQLTPAAGSGYLLVRDRTHCLLVRTCLQLFLRHRMRMASSHASPLAVR